MNKHDDKKAVIFLKNVPRTLKNKFKAHCAREDTNMTAKLIQYMRKCVQFGKEKK